ncbi:hypothetical protein LJC44_04475 [Parabacteroides sp. OttesenSCG-928-G06]|nr:hypothetical protein [Parabacteroides sp. OttesenSCG-928-G06]
MKRTLFSLFICIIFVLPAASQSQTIFIFKEFEEAKVYFKNRSVTVAPMNYDAAKNRMYFMQNEEVMELLNTQAIDSVVWNNARKFVTLEKAFLEEVKLTKGRVYIYWRLKDINVGSRGALGATTQAKVETIGLKNLGIYSTDEDINHTDLYQRKNDNDYFIRVEGKYKRFKTLKQLTKLLPEQKEMIETYAKNEKIDMKNVVSVLQLLDYCFSLIR